MQQETRLIHRLTRVTVLIALLLPAALAAENFTVRNADEIRNIMAFAQPGDTLFMSNGVWTDERIAFSGNGTAENPIVLRAETPGSVILVGESTLRMGGSYLVVDGLRFLGVRNTTSTVIEFRTGSSNLANHCRVTNTAIVDYNVSDISREGKWISMYGTHNRVDHCYIKGKTYDGATLVIWADAEPDSHLIDHNYFGFRPPLGKNGGETIRIGTSDWSMFDSGTIVEHNYFEKCDGEIEIISNKTGDNTFRYNTFYDSEGMLTLRHGNGSYVYGNFFIGKGNGLAGGVRVIGEDHVVYNNYFEGLNGTGLRSALPIMNGVPNSPLNRYFQVKRATIAFNTFVNCASSINLGAGADSERSLPPMDVVIANNVVLAENTLITQEDAPENLTWEGNIMQGMTLGIDQPAGITLVDPQLMLAADSLWRPQAGSPVVGAAVGTYDQVTDDMDGQSRGAMKDIGADQISGDPILRTPLTADSDVGPAWLKGDAPRAVIVAKEGEGNIVLNPFGGIYTDGQEVTITAIADSGWTFQEWRGDISSTDNPLTVTIDGDLSLTAVFDAPPQYDVAAWATGRGRIALTPAGGTYFEGTELGIEAIPDPGWQFQKWGGDLSGSENPTTLLIDTDKTILVTFVEGGQSGGVFEATADMDLRAAVDSAAAMQADTLMLMTDGGVYTSRDSRGVQITRPLTIMAAPGMQNKPVLINSDSTGGTLEILRVFDHLTLDGVDFDGGHPDSHGMKYAIRIQPTDELTPRTGVNLTVTNSYFHDFFQDKDPNADGHAIRLGIDVFAGNIFVENCTFENFGYEAIRISDTEKYQTTKAVNSLTVRNCTFINIDAECIRFYGDLDDNTADAAVVMEHLTIYNSATRVAYIKNNRNSIFRNIIIANSRLSGHNRDNDISEVQSTGSRTSHIDTFRVRSNVEIEAPKGGTVDQSTIYGFDPMFADPDNGDFTLPVNSPLQTLGHDGSALGDLRWASMTTAIGDDAPAATPETFALEQNYPNPFNPSTLIRFQTIAPGRVVITVRDLAGRVVGQPFAGWKDAGSHAVVFDAVGLPSGVYFYSLRQGAEQITRKMVLVR